jgi:hypothetical protein
MLPGDPDVTTLNRTWKSIPVCLAPPTQSGLVTFAIIGERGTLVRPGGRVTRPPPLPSTKV